MDDETLAQWFAANKTLLETAYLASKDPWQQSGSGIGKQRTAEQWIATRRFDYVRTNLEYVPDELQAQFVHRLYDLFVASGGWLLVAEYRAREDTNPALTVDHRLAQMGFVVQAVTSAYWQGVEKTRLAVLEKPQELA